MPLSVDFHSQKSRNKQVACRRQSAQEEPYSFSPRLQKADSKMHFPSSFTLRTKAASHFNVLLPCSYVGLKYELSWIGGSVTYREWWAKFLGRTPTFLNPDNVFNILKAVWVTKFTWCIFRTVVLYSKQYAHLLKYSSPMHISFVTNHFSFAGVLWVLRSSLQ